MGKYSYFFLSLSFVLISLLLVNVVESAPSNKETTAQPSATTGVTKSAAKEDGNDQTTVKPKTKEEQEGAPTIAPVDGEGNRAVGEEAESADKKGKDGKSTLKEKTDEVGEKIKGSANKAKDKITKWGDAAKDSLSSFFG